MSNLWITGGCTFSPNESANPTLTILVVTYRAADAFVDRYLKESGSTRVRRREFITLPAKCLGGLLIYTLAGEPIHLQGGEETIRLPLRFFTASEATIVAAACERIFPSDESGPGAKEAVTASAGS